MAGGVGELHRLTYSFTDTYRRPAQMRPGCTRDSCYWRCCVVRGRPTRRDAAAACCVLASNVTTEVSSEARASSAHSARPPRLVGGTTRIDERHGGRLCVKCVNWRCLRCAPAQVAPEWSLTLKDTVQVPPTNDDEFRAVGRCIDQEQTCRRAYATWTGVSSD